MYGRRHCLRWILFVLAPHTSKLQCLVYVYFCCSSGVSLRSFRVSRWPCGIGDRVWTAADERGHKEYATDRFTFDGSWRCSQTRRRVAWCSRCRTSAAYEAARSRSIRIEGRRSYCRPRRWIRHWITRRWITGAWTLKIKRAQVELSLWLASFLSDCFVIRNVTFGFLGGLIFSGSLVDYILYIMLLVLQKQVQKSHAFFLPTILPEHGKNRWAQLQRVYSD